MIRNDPSVVIFDIWNSPPTPQLSRPKDVHSSNVARKLGLLHRNLNDSKALFELDISLRALDTKDPIKYDFAIFGVGNFERF